jgi:hypothetical protein
MDAAALPRRKAAPYDLLIGHCLVLEQERRPTALDRLEAMLGRDFTRRLVSALSSR